MLETQAQNRNMPKTIFQDLFSDRQRALQLYQCLYPDDTAATEEDIIVEAPGPVNVVGMRHDASIIVRDERSILFYDVPLEWRYSSLARLLAVDAMDSVFAAAFRLNPFGQAETPIHLPSPMHYIVYSGDRRVRPELHVGDIFGWGSDSSLRVSADVVTPEEATGILEAYMRYIQMLSERGRSDGCTEETARAVVHECIDQGILADYLEEDIERSVRMAAAFLNEIQNLLDLPVNLQIASRDNEISAMDMQTLMLHEQLKEKQKVIAELKNRLKELEAGDAADD